MWGYYICTGHSHEPVQMWTHLYRLWLWTGTGVQRLFSILLSPCPSPPPHSSSSSLQLELPFPNRALGSFCPICDDFSTIWLIEVV
jgi:hypothetical protein